MKLAALTLVSFAIAAAPGCTRVGSTTAALPACGLDFSTPNYAGEVDRSGSPNQLLRWAHFPLRIHFAQTQTFLGLSSDEQFREGFRRWAGASGGGISWTETPNADDADIIIRTILAGSQPGPNEALGTTTVQYFASSRQIVSAEIRVYTWPNMTAAQFRDGLLATATHEVGHALFLLGHSPESSDLMYAVGSVNSDKGVSVRDANTLLTSYCGSFIGGQAPIAAALPGEAPKEITISCPGHEHDH